ncbi:MAG: T9SS type A sorting domain-containing protein [Bacteroidetes bacterium]|nr:T9SS type A sorting domain-containing protein [Bacteroidota bacterium]
MSCRRIFTRALTVLVALLVSQQSFAQITAYTRTVLSGQTYTQITGGTVINTTVQLSASMSTNADDGAVLVTLPFTFTYNGNTFTQVTFCTNGWIGMGNQLAVTAAQGRASGNLFSATVPNNTLAPWFGDMSANFPAPAGIGSMVHGTMGTGIYAFEWRNATGSGFGTTTVNLINFMIKIYGPASSAPGRIEFLYGSQSGALTVGRTIGIEDAVGGTNRYINALNGLSNNTSTAGAWPGNGTGYRFDPPIPCSGTPAAGTVVAPATVCSGSGFTLSLAGNTTGNGIAYQWQSKPSAGTTFNNVAGATASTLTTTISVPTDFRCVVTCTPSASSVITPAVSIGINSFYICYCKGSLGGSTVASIDSVSILGTTLQSASPGAAATFYTQYAATGNRTATLQAGGLYTFYLKYGSGAIASIWIDGNQNGNFEPSEWTQLNTTGTSALAYVQVPPNALTGLTGMRIRTAAAGSANGASNVCGNFTTGETEDYVINIIQAPLNDLKLVTLLSPPSGNPTLCPFKDIPVRAVIYNNGSVAQSGFTVVAKLTGPAPATNTYSYTNTLLPFKTDTISLATYNFNITGSFAVKSYVVPGIDADPLNDSSAFYPFTIAFSAAPPVIHVDSVCYGETAVLSLDNDTLVHNWYKTSTGGTPFYNRDTIILPNMQRDTTFFVSAQGKKLIGSLTTLNAPNNGCSAGAMFDIIPNRNMSLDSLAARFASSGSQTVKLYYKLGSYSGFENNASAWTLWESITVNPATTTNLELIKPSSPLVLTVGNTYGIYVSYNAQYTNGTGTFANADITLNAGAGFCTAFTSAIAGRQFNGTLFYSSGASLCESPLIPITAYAGPAPLVNLGVDLTICEDVKIILDAGFYGGKYLWSTGATTQAIELKNKPGTYWATVDKYCVSSDTVVINVNPLPSTTGISYLRIGDTYSFEAADVKDATKWLWIFGDGATDNTTLKPSHTYTNGLSNKVRLLLFNDCGVDTTDLQLPLGVNTPIAENDIKVYPNPASEKLTVTTGNAVITSLTMINAVGQVVYQSEDIQTNKLDIDVSKMQTGNYILRIMNKDAMVTKTLTIKR